MNVMNTAQNEVGYFLLKRHSIDDPVRADFFYNVSAGYFGRYKPDNGYSNTLLSGIAAISLVVGGIGIMNIMLVTVTERTREIGLRKALGAKRRLVTLQFLIESIILVFAGGFLGIFLGSGVSYFISWANSLPFTLSPLSVVLARGVCWLIGIVFGWYPAQKAANLTPIEVLRYE